MSGYGIGGNFGSVDERNAQINTVGRKNNSKINLLVSTEFGAFSKRRMESNRDPKEQNSDIIEIQELEDQIENDQQENDHRVNKIDMNKYNSSMIPATRPVM